MHPWQVDANCLPSGNDRQPWVILVLGEPSSEALAPLWQSPHLSSSLLIIATVGKYSPPASFTPSIAVLHLSSPLISSEAQTSTRLVSALRWAHQVAQHWRSSPPVLPQFRVYEEEAPTGYLTPPRLSGRLSWFSGLGNNNNSSSSASIITASSSVTELGLMTPPPTRSTSRLSLSKKSPDSTTSISSLASLSVPAINDAKHAFDTIFNFLPALDSTDATLLKFAILVTTISRPFITCTLPTFYLSSASKPSRRFALRPDDLPPPVPSSPVQPPPPAHIVHVVPALRSSLITPLETFCLSFASPSQSLPTFTAPSRIDVGKPGPSPRPFILSPLVLGEVLPISCKWTITELILCGALDGSSKLGLTNRAWLAGSNEIHVTGGSRSFQKSAVKASGFGATAYRPSLLRNHACSSHAEENESGENGDTCHHSQWPTPPSSNSSSPAPSVAASVSADPATTTTTKDFGPSSIGLLTPPESDSSDSSHMARKRRGILKWIRRR